MTLTNNQVKAVREFLVAFTHELPPAMLIKLLKKVIIDIPVLNQTSITPLTVSETIFHCELVSTLIVIQYC